MTNVVAGWDVTGKIQVPKIHLLDIGFCALSFQKANVERVRKAHKTIQENSRNRRKKRTTQKLLFTYVNLRMLKSRSTELSDFWSDGLNLLEGTRRRIQIMMARDLEAVTILIFRTD